MTNLSCPLMLSRSRFVLRIRRRGLDEVDAKGGCRAESGLRNLCRDTRNSFMRTDMELLDRSKTKSVTI